MDTSTFKIIPITEEDRKTVFEFHKRHFLKYEPMNMSFEVPMTIRFEESGSLKHVKEGLSFMMVKDDLKTVDSIVGIVLNAEEKKGSDELPEIIQKTQNEPLKKIITILDRVKVESDKFSKIDDDKTFLTNLLAVDQQYKGQRIGQRLMEHSLEFAKSKGYRYASVECTSAYSAIIMKKLNYELYYSLAYEDHRDENNEVIFRTQHPHTHIKAFLKKL